ncbi:zf-HC2 domain-containing protein [Streptomyces sp. B6B3]|uniref:anti-sigma factor family protein n=1 Tax=Streptomyces sp. B6B3 TaxID=3153570 RepID=UPI00325F507F
MNSHDDTHLLLGAYVLGGLDAADRRRVEAHLAGCAACRDELADAEPLHDLLRSLPPEAAGRAPASRPEATPGLDSLLHTLRAEKVRARRRGRQLMASAAAVVLLALGGLGVTLLRDAETPGGTPSGPSVSFVAGGETATSGRAVLTGKPWGTEVDVQLADLPAGGPFVLEVTGIDGAVERAATWSETAAAEASLVGASSLRPSDIEVMRVVDHEGRTVATARP